ncbi:MAG: two-component system, cell cycle response regulator [Thermoanaerobaculia bacterium]|jgi:diguanylate cyclase (GGDEF)-like protein|nr:two-component system, cell cycle response regulator [Thermoanaerobaculia bacterium]
MAAILNVVSATVNSALRRRSDLPPESQSEAIRVLIVEDDENFGMWLAAVAHRLGLDVARASDGLEALTMLRAAEFDLLISDLEMPRKNGLQLIAAVRAEPSINGLYAVMLTAHDSPAVKVNALTLGYDDFLAKGCTEVEVVAKVAAARRMLARQRALDADAREWRDIANQDELTKVATRRFFFEQAEQHLAGKHGLGIVLFDIDDFKAINDNYGHLMGDRVLKDIGALFLRRTRSEDLIARYGGDEFVLLVLNLGAEETRSVADRLLAELSELQWTAGDTTLHLGMTMGLGCSALIDDPTVERLLETADHELYALKWLKKHPSVVPPEAYQYPRATDVALFVAHKADEVRDTSIAPHASKNADTLRLKSEV